VPSDHSRTEASSTWARQVATRPGLVESGLVLTVFVVLSLSTYNVIVMASERMTNMRRQLQKECSRALGTYIQVIQEGCDLLGQIKEGLIPEDKREVIFSHRKQELWAYAAYTRARRRLWRFLSDSEPPLARMDGTPQRKGPSSKRSGPALQEIDRLMG
jgi:hypothetical protein